MQRVISNFPSGLPGVGLLALRLVLALFVAIEGGAYLLNAIDAAGPPGRALAYGIGLILLSSAVGLGLLSSFVHAIIAVIELAAIGNMFQSLGLNSCLGGNWQVATLEASIAIAIALIGPGAYSVDRRLFGPRKIAIPPRQS